MLIATIAAAGEDVLAQVGIAAGTR